ncbi:MAG TPA: hypothetical protein PLW09_04220, partial [Candidatus Kapabacteria bacterium]|nr:hypothetical protein [Candidatus Kapabacteria bacterium]
AEIVNGGCVLISIFQLTTSDETSEIKYYLLRPLCYGIGTNLSRKTSVSLYLNVSSLCEPFLLSSS